MILLIFLKLSLSFSSSLEVKGGGDHIGNGGDAVFCRPNLVQFYDVYETRFIKGWELKLGSSRSYISKVKKVVKNLYVVDPVLAQKVEEYFSEFLKNYSLANGHLPLIDDSFHAPIPLHCKFVQAAYSYFNEHGSWVVRIDRNIWGRLDSDNKAALALHEILYRLAVQNGVRHSIGVRHINSILLSQRQNDLDFINERISAGIIP